MYLKVLSNFFFVRREAHRRPYMGKGEKGMGKGRSALWGFELTHLQFMCRSLTELTQGDKVLGI